MLLLLLYEFYMGTLSLKGKLETIFAPKLHHCLAGDPPAKQKTIY